MMPDYKWLADFIASEIKRLRDIEVKAIKQEQEIKGNLAKYDYLINQETAKDAEYQRARRIEEKKLEHPQAILAAVTPKLDKLSEQWAILNAFVV